MSHYGINIEFQHPDPEAPLLKSPLRLVTWGPHQAQSAWRKQSVQPGLNDSTRKVLQPMMLRWEFPMLHRNTTKIVAVKDHWEKRNNQENNFQIVLGQKWALVDLPMLDPFQTMEIIQICAWFTGSYGVPIIFPSKLPENHGPPGSTPRMGCPASEHEKLQQGPYPMSWQCQPITEDMTRKKLWDTWMWLVEHLRKSR